jgi:hypothetical protein
MANERPMTMNRLQREHMVSVQEASGRQAIALERLIVLFETYLTSMGVEVPESTPGSVEPQVVPAPQPSQAFNPYTESAPGVPLPGQEADDGEKSA